MFDPLQYFPKDELQTHPNRARELPALSGTGPVSGVSPLHRHPPKKVWDPQLGWMEVVKVLKEPHSMHSSGEVQANAQLGGPIDMTNFTESQQANMMNDSMFEDSHSHVSPTGVSYLS